jgi:nitrogen regulatory protein PII
MKMILAIYNIAIDVEIMEAVRQAGIQFYTKWPRVVGEGPRTGPRLDDHIWPGANMMMMMVAADELAANVMEALKGLRQSIGKTEGLQAFLLNVEGQL